MKGMKDNSGHKAEEEGEEKQEDIPKRWIGHSIIGNKIFINAGVAMS